MSTTSQSQDQKTLLINALKTIILTPHIRKYLVVYDPKALDQAQAALKED